MCRRLGCLLTTDPLLDGFPACAVPTQFPSVAAIYLCVTYQLQTATSILLPDRQFGTCLFNLYAEYIMRNARLDETQARIKISGRNINSLRYADDTTLVAEKEEKLKSLLMKVKEESEKIWLKLQHSEN